MPNMILQPLKHNDSPLTGYQAEQVCFAKMKAEFRQRKRRAVAYLLRRKLRGLAPRARKTGRPEARPAPSLPADQRPMQLA